MWADLNTLEMVMIGSRQQKDHHLQIQKQFNYFDKKVMAQIKGRDQDEIIMLCIWELCITYSQHKLSIMHTRRC